MMAAPYADPDCAVMCAVAIDALKKALALAW
jgi:hypothetical protein